MNFEYNKLLYPIKVYVINPLAPASRLLTVKMLSGIIFGDDQPIDLNLVIYSNEIKSAEAFKLELESCSFSCTSSIRVSSDLPSCTLGDVFCFITDFANPNIIEFKNEDDTNQFNALYLIIKLANSFIWPNEETVNKSEVIKRHDFKNKDGKARNHIKSISGQTNKPIFIADGLVVIDILKSLSKNMPPDIFFCPTPVTPITKSVLGDYLNVHCNIINDVHVWAANDNVFHIEVDKPLIRHDVLDESPCNMDVMGKDCLESLNLDSTQISASFLKKEFVEKVASSASKNPYGCIYRAVEFSRTLRDIWLTRNHDCGKVSNSMGVISDGSLGTITGLPYVLPIVFENGIWSVNKRFEDDIHLKQEIIRINKEVKQRHEQLMLHCKRFLQENIIDQDFSE